MGFFSKTPNISTDENKINELLTRGVSEVLVGDSLRKKLLSGRQLRIKLGIDPTSPNLHLGRSIPLLKLRDFQELGHKVVFIVGDFTAVIGDTSDKEAERPMLSHDVIEQNKKTYMQQVGKLIDIQEAEFRYNSEWLSKLSYTDISQQADYFSVADFIARDNIKKRLDEGKRVSLREVLYPLMQGYDSVAVDADVELGGTDQKFNVLAGRTMQEKMRHTPQDVLITPLIEGTDGRKMSSSWGNTITLTASPDDMYGKIMSMRDDQVPIYFETCTRVPMEEVGALVAGHPKDAKMRLAREIVSLYHGAAAAQEAEAQFTAIFNQGAAPQNILTIQLTQGGADEIATQLVEKGVVASKTELRRLLAQGAIHDLSGTTISSLETITTPIKLRIGKHRFVELN